MRKFYAKQDIDEFRKWKWNETLETSQSFLTGTGYEELYDIAKRIRERYPHLLHGSDEKYYFRSTDEQRTVTSGMAFVHGLAEGTNLNLTVDGPWERDNIIRVSNILCTTILRPYDPLAHLLPYRQNEYHLTVSSLAYFRYISEITQISQKLPG